jgi:PemK-like, MazF-like toxin of type II toxin-antitoxin system
VVPVTGTPGEGLLYPALAPGQNGLAKRPFALTDQLRSIDKRRIRRVFGELAREETAAIDEGVAAFMARTRRRSSDEWLPIVDAFRTLALCPPPAVRAAFQQIQALAAV